MLVFSKKEKIMNMTVSLIKIELLTNSQISNDRNTLPYPKRIDSVEYDKHQYQASQKS